MRYVGRSNRGILFGGGGFFWLFSDFVCVYKIQMRKGGFFGTAYRRVLHRTGVLKKKDGFMIFKIFFVC